MLVLMALPAAVACALVMLRPLPGLAAQWRAPRLLTLVLVVFVLSALRPILWQSLGDDITVTRAYSSLVIAALAAFAVANRRLLTRSTFGLGLIGALLGGALNSAAALIYGGMPILGSAAEVAGYNLDSAATAADGYVYSRPQSASMVLLGDFIPLPGFYKVLSVGDLLLFAGLAMVAAVGLARIWSPPTMHVADGASRPAPPEPSGDTWPSGESGCGATGYPRDPATEQPVTRGTTQWREG